MAFTKLSVGAAGADASRGPISAAETDIWTIFRALRDARSVFGLRPGHIQTLQAMLSFLKPGHGETVFASNNSICQRVGGTNAEENIKQSMLIAALDDAATRSITASTNAAALQHLQAARTEAQKRSSYVLISCAERAAI